MPPDAEIVYFDAGVFIAWFNDEPVRADAIEQVLAASLEQTVQVVTSIVSLTEVAYYRQDRVRLSPDDMDRQINTLLLNESLIALVPLDQEVALRARQLVRAGPSRRERLTVLDAIHLASAEHIGADYFATYDGDFSRSANRVEIPVGPPTLEFNR